MALEILHNGRPLSTLAHARLDLAVHLGCVLVQYQRRADSPEGARLGHRTPAGREWGLRRNPQCFAESVEWLLFYAKCLRQRGSAPRRAALPLQKAGHSQGLSDTRSQLNTEQTVGERA